MTVAALSERGHADLTRCIGSLEETAATAFEPVLKEEFEPAVVVSRQRGHDAFLANFAPITLVENVPDTREHSGSPLPKSKFGRQIPDVVGGNETFEGIAIITKFIVNERSKHARV